MYFIFS